MRWRGVKRHGSRLLPRIQGLAFDACPHVLVHLKFAVGKHSLQSAVGDLRQ